MNQRLNDFSSLRTHPYSIMVYFLLAGLTMLFAALSAAYVYTRVQSSAAPIKIPWIFLFNTAVLYASNWSLKKAKSYYVADDTKGYQIALWGTLILTLLFMALQFVGWKMLLVDNPDTFKGGNMSAYVYAISILHFLHIIGGLPFFIIFLITAYIRMKEPVSVLVYFSDPLKRLRLNLLLLYWHFLDYLWIYLIVFFWANYFIQIPK
jgi:cytochrome c oxidase subunit 3